MGRTRNDRSRAAQKQVRRKDGTFRAGVSGNPSGVSRRVAAAIAAAAAGAAMPPRPPREPADADHIVRGDSVERRDGWRNHATGQGVPGVDKTLAGSFWFDFLNFDQLQNLYRGDDLAAHVVEKMPKDAFREGWELIIADDEGKARATDIMKRCELLGVDGYLETAACFERAYGGAATLLGANDASGDLTLPLNFDRINAFDWITPLEARECMPVYGYTNPNAPKYGQAELYQLISRSVLPSRAAIYYPSTMWIHESRLLVMPGVRVSRYQVTTSAGGWGDSVLGRVYRVLRNFNAAWDGTSALLADFAQAVLKMSELWTTIATDDAGGFSDRLQAMAYARSVLNMMVIDGNDDFERKQTPMTGLPDVLREFMIRICAAADMPATVLFGMSPAGLNATGESDLALWYDRVAAYQRKKILPMLRQIVRALFRVTGDGREPPAWSIKFRPLRQEAPKDREMARWYRAQADDIEINNGTTTAAEVSASRYGGPDYSYEMHIDPALQAQREELAGLKMARALEQARVPYTPPPPPGSAVSPGAPPPPSAPAAPDPNTPPQPAVEQNE